MSLRTLLRKSGENHIPSASVRLGATSPSYQMTLFSFHNRSLLFNSDFVMLFTISSTSSSIKIAAIILRPQAGKHLSQLLDKTNKTNTQFWRPKSTVAPAKIEHQSTLILIGYQPYFQISLLLPLKFVY